MVALVRTSPSSARGFVLLRWIIVCSILLGSVCLSRAAEVSFELLAAPGGTPSSACALSADGSTLALIAGGQYYRRSRDTGLTELADGHPLATTVGVSGDGRVVCGTATDSAGRRIPAFWRADAAWTRLIDPSRVPAAFENLGGAYAANHDGSVIVGLIWTARVAQAFRWTTATGAVPLTDSGTGSRATAVAARGDVIVGFDEHPRTGRRRPARWSGGRLELIAGPDRSGEILAVDAAGDRCCGQVDGRAFYHDDSVGLVELGVLGDPQWDRSLARSLSEKGVVVGWSGDPTWGRREAFVWTAGSGMQALADWLVQLGVSLPDGLHLTDVHDVSADGTTLAGAWQDADWNLGLWLVSGLEPAAYAALPAAGDGAPGWQRTPDDPARTPPPLLPGRPVLIR
jgi:uncharacterized membrane protein